MIVARCKFNGTTVQTKVDDKYKYSYRRCSRHEFMYSQVVGAVRDCASEVKFLFLSYRS